MTVATVSTFLAAVAVASLVAAVLLMVVRFGPQSGVLARLRNDLGQVALPAAWLVATVATLGSLYFSEIANFTPCKLCWFQRIAMYPLVVILGVATLTKDPRGRLYAFPLAAIGAAIGLYHSYLQAYPGSGSSFCTLEAPCTQRHVWEFGFVSLPLMAFAGFTLIAALLLVVPRHSPCPPRRRPSPPPDHPIPRTEGTCETPVSQP